MKTTQYAWGCHGGRWIAATLLPLSRCHPDESARPIDGDFCRKLIFLLLIVALALNAIVSRPTMIEGDGSEYFLMTHSLLAHRSVDLQKQDLLALDRAQRRAGNLVQLPEYALRATEPSFPGYSRAANGKLYCYHYWLYPLVNVPALAASERLGFAPGRSFLLTNSALAALAAFFILFGNKLKNWARISILAMFLLGGTTFYLSYSGPEVFTACLIAIGLILGGTGRTLCATLAFAIAAQQNPPVGFLALATLAFWTWQCLKQRPTRRRLVLEVTGAIGVLIFLAQSPLFYRFHFGVSSLIAAHGWATPELISYRRLLSYYFDPDQGISRGAPFLLAGLFMTSLLALWRFRANPRQFATGLILIAASVAIAIPSSATETWVSSCRTYMRHAYWGGVPLWFAAVYFCGQIVTRRCLLMLGTAILLQAVWAINMHYFDRFAMVMHLVRGHSWITQQIIDRFPQYYNPNPSIFTAYAPELNADVQPAPEVVYYLEHPGRISKLLYHPKGRANWIPECAATPADLEKRPGVEHIAEERGWSYLNLGQACKTASMGKPVHWMAYRDRPNPLPSSGISFKWGGNGADYIAGNWTFLGDSVGWFEGDTPHLSIHLAQARPTSFALLIQGRGYALAGEPFREAAVHVNGFPIGNAQFSTQTTPTSVTLTIPAALVERSNGVFHVRLLLKNLVLPEAARRETRPRKPAIVFAIAAMNILPAASTP